MNIDAILLPIAGLKPCGEDMAFSEALDVIRDARKNDDDSLSQGEWQTSIKSAQWPKVVTLCEAVLTQRSKDLQVAGWLADALVRVHGFAGLTNGLVVLNGLFSLYWEGLYPVLDPEDLDERAAKIEWLSKELTSACKLVPITKKDSGNFHFLHWEESRRVDNLGLKDPAAKEAAVAEGKISGELFDKAVAASGKAWYQELASDLQQSQAQLWQFIQSVDEKFGYDAPSLTELRVALDAVSVMTARILLGLGGVSTSPTQAASLVTSAEMEYGAEAAPVKPSPSIDLSTLSVADPIMPSVQISNRSQAVQQLREVASYFRQAEPHSPVAFLADRAADWADMPLDRWLSQVIKDESTLYQLKDMLGVASSDRS